MSWQIKVFIIGVLLGVIFPPFLLAFLIVAIILIFSGASHLKITDTIYFKGKSYIIVEKRGNYILGLRYWTSYSSALVAGCFNPRHLSLYHTLFLDRKLTKIKIKKGDDFSIQKSVFKYSRKLNEYIKELLENEKGPNSKDIQIF